MLKPALSMPSCALPQCDLSFALEETHLASQKCLRKSLPLARQPYRNVLPKRCIFCPTEEIAVLQEHCTKALETCSSITTSQCRRPSCCLWLRRSPACTFHVIFLLCLSLQCYMWSALSWVGCQTPLLLKCFQGSPTVFA